jgi:flagellar biosynthesis protein FliQ
MFHSKSETAQHGHLPAGALEVEPSFRDGPQDQTSDVQLHIGESRDSGFSPADCPGMTNAIQRERDKKMTGAETLDVARDAIWTIVVVSSPLMVVGLVVGVVVSLFQALTQIQEQTLVFVPKILAIFVTLLLALPFMADSLHSHMMRISSRIIGG